MEFHQAHDEREVATERVADLRALAWAVLAATGTVEARKALAEWARDEPPPEPEDPTEAFLRDDPFYGYRPPVPPEFEEHRRRLADAGGYDTPYAPPPARGHGANGGTP